LFSAERTTRTEAEAAEMLADDEIRTLVQCRKVQALTTMCMILFLRVYRLGIDGDEILCCKVSVAVAGIVIVVAIYESPARI
jgi:hypothetical protein